MYRQGTIMARPRTNFDPTREALVRTACRLFSDRGFEETPISLIMSESGLTKAGMYHYFSSKEEILEEAIGIYLRKGVERMRDESAGRSVEERLVIFIRGSVQPDDISRSLEAMKGSRPDSFAAYRIRERSVHADIPVLEEILQEGMASGMFRGAGSPRAVAGMLVILAKALVEHGCLPDAGPEERMGRLAAYLDLVRVWLVPPEELFSRLQALLTAEVRASVVGNQEGSQGVAVE
jgi:AcrR family transcriptional regulator